MTLYLYRVHINETFFVDVQAPDVEAAFLQSFAHYQKEHPSSKTSTLESYEISIVNLTQYDALSP
jgi:hypothetical protein